MLVEHAANANAVAGDSVHEGRRIARDHEFASTTDLSGPADCWVGFKSVGAAADLSHDPVGSNLAEIGVERSEERRVGKECRL